MKTRCCDCFDCKYCSVAILAGKEFAKCLIEGTYTNIIRQFPMTHKAKPFGDCEYYKRKWWKFWR